ncbi:hypothetical protein WN943_004575 [Citrus x changshan-huyou]
MIVAAVLQMNLRFLVVISLRRAQLHWIPSNGRTDHRVVWRTVKIGKEMGGPHRLLDWGHPTLGGFVP